MVLEFLEVVQLLSNPDGWATLQMDNFLTNAKRCRQGIAPQAPLRVLSYVKSRKGHACNKDSTAEPSALHTAVAAKLTRCSAAYGKGRQIILEIL